MARTKSANLKQHISGLLDVAERGKALATYDSESVRRRMAQLSKEGTLARPLPRLFARAEYWSSLNPRDRLLHKMRGLTQLDSGIVFAGTSSAVAYGLDVSYWLLERPVLAVLRRAHSRSSDDICRLAVDGDTPTMAMGMRVTSFGRTLFDCLRLLPFREALVVADSALRMLGNDPSRLMETLEPYRGKRGYNKTCLVAKWADGLSANGGESLARAFFIEHGYLLPRLQVRIPDPIDGRTNYYADFFWELPDGGAVIGELDGRLKYRDQAMTGGRDVVDVLADERLRESRISATGALVMRFSIKDLETSGMMGTLLERFGISKVVESWLDDGDEELAG